MSTTPKYQHLSLEIKKSPFKYVLLKKLPSDLSNTPKPFCLFASDDECSVIVKETATLENTLKEDSGWDCWQIKGEMPFGTVQGLIAEISSALFNEAQVGVCVASSFQTDYFFIRTKNKENAQKALSSIGWKINTEA